MRFAVLASILGACGGDDAALSLAFLAPADGTFVTGVTEIRIDAAPSDRIDRVTVRVGANVIARLTEPPYVFDLNPAEFPDGPLTLAAEIVPSDENEIAPQSVMLTIAIDKLPPTIEILEPRAAFREDGDSFSIQLRAMDVSSVEKVAVVVRGDGTESRQTVYSPGEQFAVDVPWQDVLPGPVSDWANVDITITAVDAAGREATIETSYSLGTRLLWVHNVAGLMPRPPVVADDGTVWVGGTKISPDEGRILRIDPADGTMICELPLGIETIYSGTQAGDLMVFGTSRAVRAVRRDDCGLAWTFGDPVGDPRSYWGTPAYDAPNDLIYAADADGRLVAIVATTGAGAGTLDFATEIQSSPVVAPNGNVFVGAVSGAMYGTDGTTAALPWSPYATAGSIFGDPIMSGGSLYFGSMDSFFYALDPETGALRPGFGVQPDGFAIRSTPAIAPDGAIVVATIGGELHAIEPDGQPRWDVSIAPVSRGGVTIRADDPGGWTAYIGATDGDVYAVDQDGELQWQASTGAQIQTYGALGDSAFYTPSDDFRLYAYDLVQPVYRP